MNIKFYRGPLLWALCFAIPAYMGCASTGRHTKDTVVPDREPESQQEADTGRDKGDPGIQKDVKEAETSADLHREDLGTAEVKTDTGKPDDGVGVDACQPQCKGRQCGDDGCGGSCGTCGPTQWCTGDTQVCVECEKNKWIKIPGGTFLMGEAQTNPNIHPNTVPVHRVTVPDFEMQKTEVTICRFRQCVHAGVCHQYRNTFNAGPTPAIYIDWFQAEKYCKWIHARLCTESEWEYAARNGDEDTTYPWGNNQPDCTRATYGKSVNKHCVSTFGIFLPVCSKPAGNNKWGICDLAGNVSEWVQDWYHSNYEGAPTDGSAWEYPPMQHRITRGGNYNSDAPGIKSTSRDYSPPPGYTYSDIGIRCCRPVVKKE